MAGRRHATDVTNAHRTSLVALQDGRWDERLLAFYGISREHLPAIQPTAGEFGVLGCTRLAGVPVTAVLGDQHASLLGQDCTREGQVKNTYGTGCFLLCNTGARPIITDDGLITTIAFQLGPSAPLAFALEASISSAGSSIKWMTEQLGLLKSSAELGTRGLLGAAADVQTALRRGRAAASSLCPD